MRDEHKIVRLYRPFNSYTFNPSSRKDISKRIHVCTITTEFERSKRYNIVFFLESASFSATKYKETFPLFYLAEKSRIITDAWTRFGFRNGFRNNIGVEINGTKSWRFRNVESFRLKLTRLNTYICFGSMSRSITCVMDNVIFQLETIENHEREREYAFSYRV